MMTKLIFILTCLFGVIGYSQEKSEIILPSAVEVSPREVITVYDIIESRNMNDSLREELRNIKLGDADTRMITRSELIRKLKNVKSNYRLPTEVKILRSKSNVSRMEVERKIKNHLLAKCGECDYTIQINSVPQSLGSDWDLDLNIDFNRASVMVPIFSMNNPQQKGWVTVEVKKYALVPVLNRALKIGDVITEEAMTMDKRLVNSYQDIITSKEAVVGMQAAKFLSAGQMIGQRDVKREQVMKKGQMVKAIFGVDALEISITAQADEAGAVGDVIRVKNLDSQKMFAAKIVDRGVVKIE